MKSNVNMEALAGKKILFASMPAEGHVNPLTGLAKYLQAVGADVRWYTGFSYAPKMAKLGIPLFPFDKAREITSENMDQLFPERGKIKGKIKKLVHDMIHVFINQAPKFIEDLEAIHREFEFDLVIAECTFSAIPLIKKVLDVPVLVIGIVPLTETSRDLPPSGLGMTPSHSYPGRVKQRSLRYICNHILFRKPNKIFHRILERYDVAHNNLSIFDISIQHADLFLQSGTPGFEYTRSDMSRNIRFIGSLLPYAVSKKPVWCDIRLALYKKIVLVTQGTVEKDVEKILVPTLEAFKNTDTLVVCTTGGTRTNELRNRFPDFNFIIEDFIPFDAVMPYANVFVTNGGYGGVMLGIENKLPMIVAGVHEGKNEICARVGYFELGINLKTETPTAKQIEEAAKKILNNPVYKTNIEKLGEEFSQYDPGELCSIYAARLIRLHEYDRLPLLSAEEAA